MKSLLKSALALLFSTLAAMLSVPESATAAVIFNYEFEAGPDGSPITSVVDSGPNGLNGAGTGLAYSSQTAPTGGSFAMNAAGDFNYVAVPDNAMMHVQSFTLSALVNPTGKGGFNGPFANCWNDSMCNIVDKKNGEGGAFLDSYSIYYVQSTGKFRGYLSFGGGNGRFIESAGSYAIGSGWHSVALSLARNVAGAADGFDLYVDGALQASLTEALPDLLYNGLPLQIGAANFFANPFGDFRRNFDGMIDSVMLTDIPIERAGVPEPASMALALAGLAAVAATRRRKPAQAASHTPPPALPAHDARAPT